MYKTGDSLNYGLSQNQWEEWVGDPIDFNPNTEILIKPDIREDLIWVLITRVEEQNKKIDELIELIKKYLTQKEEWYYEI